MPAVELAANLSAREQRSVDVHVGDTRTNGAQQLSQFARGYALTRGTDYIRRCERASHGSFGQGTIVIRGSVEVGAKEHADAPVYAQLSKVNVRLLNRDQTAIAEFPRNCTVV